MSASFCWRQATRYLATRRFYTTPPEAIGIRQKLLDEIKSALKSKDSSRTTLLRGILSEVYAADKAKGTIPTPAIVSIMRRSIAKRKEAVVQYKQGGRDDLADKETCEVEILDSFLPPMLSAEEIDRRLLAAIGKSAVVNKQKGTGKILNAFYTETDRSLVDPALVKERLDLITALE